jgi:hypothetical protein
VIDTGEARLFLDHGFQWDGSENVWLTRARGSYAVGAGPVFDIRPRAFLSRITGFYGGGTPSGDPCFDDFFTVKTSEDDAYAEHTFSALTTRARSLLASCFEDARLISDGRMVTLWREGDFGLEADADAAVEVVAEIVHYQSSVLERLRRLPGARERTASGSWDQRTPMHVVLRVASDVCVGPLNDEHGPVLGAWSACGRALRPFRLSVDECGQLHCDVDLLPEYARATASDMSALGPCELICDGQKLVLRFRSLAFQRHRLVEAARLVAALAGNSRGTYR